jgi:CBS-domain-containing membrane protein
MRLGEIMTKTVRTISTADTADDAFQLMRLHRVHHLVVVERKQVGIVSDRDLGGPRGVSPRGVRKACVLQSKTAMVAHRDVATWLGRAGANLLLGERALEVERHFGCPHVKPGRRTIRARPRSGS